MVSSYLGPTYETGTNSGTTLYSSSRDVGPIGTISGFDLDVLGLALGSGVVIGELNQAAVTAAGVNMNVDIDTGAFLVRGHPVRNTASAAVVIGANASGNPRIDRIVLRFTQKGQAEEGNAVFAVVAGTPAGSPSAPALTQSAATWEIGLAQVAVANGATSIANGNLTDERVFVAPASVNGAVIQAGTIATAALAASSVTTAKIADDAITTTKILGGAVTASRLGTDSVTTIKIADANVTNAKVATGIDAVKIGSGAVSNTEFGYLDGVTSALQTQIDAKQATDTDLTALAGVSSAGILARTGAGTAAARTITAGTGISVTNGDGVAGNPTVAIGTGIDAANLADGSVSNAELQFIGTVTSNVQTQLDLKAPLANPTFTGTVAAPTFSGSGTSTFADAVVTASLLAGSLSVTGAITTSGDITTGNADTDIIDLRGTMKTSGANPTVTYGTGAGTGPSTGSIDGDMSGCRIVFTTGTAPAAGGANIFTLNFPVARPDTNYRVIVQGVSRQAAIDNFYPFDSGRTTGGIGIAAEATLTASTEYRVDIWVIGH